MKLYKYILITALALSVSSCEKDFLDVNKSPNNPTQVSGVYTISTASVKLAYTIAGTLNRNASFWAQHWATTYTQYRNEDRYNLTPPTLNTEWGELYTGVLQNLLDAKSKAGGRTNLEAIPEILTVYTFSIITDLWGNVPYSEALGSDKFRLPKYDEQSEVYPALVERLDGAIAKINIEEEGYGTQDLIYGEYENEMELWKKFANTLKLRLLMRMSAVQNVSAEINEVISSGVLISDNSENATLVFGTIQGNYSPLYEQFTYSGRDNDYQPSATLVDKMNELNDPRRAYYYTTDGSDEEKYVGTPNGRSGIIGPHYSTFLPKWMEQGNIEAQTHPALFLTASESYFLQAEAALKGYTTGDVGDLYKKAIATSMDFWGVPEEEVNDYLENPLVDFEQATDKFALLSTQKWISLYDQGLEAYSEWRRTNYPVLQPALLNRNGDKIPVSMPYAQDEFTSNPSNVPQSKTINDKVWWDK